MGKITKLTKMISAVTIGGVLEWYEIFLYVYWAPQISKVFFTEDSKSLGLINTLLIFAFGFLARPIGGLLFGYVGDRFGRKTAFISTILLCTFPSFIIAILPTYASWGLASQIILGFIRFFQGIPAGGELPGAICYLAESSNKNNRYFTTSFAFVGAQIGAVLGIAECVIFETYMPLDFLLEHGWRISFAIGGLIGLFGFYLRHSLHETPLFQKLSRHDHILKKPVAESFLKHKKAMLTGFLISIFEVVGYFMIAVFPAVYYGQIFEISSVQILLTTGLLLLFSAVTMPFFGKLGDRFGARKFLFLSSALTFVLTIPWYFSILSLNFISTILIQCLIILVLNFQFALLPYTLAELFPTQVRFSCLGLSFNMCDSVIGGLTPIIAICCIGVTSDPASFVALLASVALISCWLFSGPRKKAVFDKRFDMLFRCTDHIGRK